MQGHLKSLPTDDLVVTLRIHSLFVAFMQFLSPYFYFYPSAKADGFIGRFHASEAEVTEASFDSGYIPAKSVPYPIAVSAPADLYSAYGFAAEEFYFSGWCCRN